MSRMNWIIPALVLMITGAAGLGWGLVQKRAEANHIARAAEAVTDAPSADEYLAMYDQWSQLPPARKAETPWGQGQYGGPEIQRRFRQDQKLRLEADLPALDAGVKSYPLQLADVLYGVSWPERLADYQRRRDIRNLTMTASAIMLFAGALLSCAALVKTVLIRILLRSLNVEQPPAAETKSEQNTKTARRTPRTERCADGEDAPPKSQREQDPKPLHSPGYFESASSRKKKPESGATPYLPKSPDKAAAARAVTVLDTAAATDDASYFGWAMDAQETDVPVSTMMTTRPVATTGLSELTEEVSAIRQYAAAQQDQMRKLQDGYDWMIIRRFCLRVIRCVDNLDDRLGKLGPQDQILQCCLEDIRDELVFALESSGVEQYQPDLNIPFKGLEKYAEAVRQRVPASDAAMAGTIAEIVRPGYQYLISDNDIKIVRCAQVKLYDTAETAVSRS